MLHNLEPRAVVTMSGGIDSTVLATILSKEGVDVTAFFVDYGQANAAVTYAMVEKQAKHLGIANVIKQKMDYSWSNASILSGNYQDEGITHDNVYKRNVKDVSWVPARNANIMLMAGGVASTLGIKHVYASFQFDKVEWAQYDALLENEKCRFAAADLTPAFMERLNALAPFCYKGAVEFLAPFVDRRLDVHDITRIGLEYGAKLDDTYSCRYALGENQDQPCGHCEQCVIREQRLAGTIYA